MRLLKILTLTTAMTSAAGGVQAADFTLRYSTMGSPTAPLFVCGAQSMLQELAAASGGRIDFETYQGGTAFANPTMQYEQVARGVTDISQGPLTYAPGRFALAEIATVPLLTGDNVAGSIAMTRLASTWLAEEFADIHLMADILTTPYQFHMAQPSANVTDLEQRRMRVSGPGLTAMTEIFNGIPTGMPLPEVYEALQRGVIDGAIAPWTAVPTFNLDEVAPYHIEGDLAVGLTFMGMSKRFYDSLPADLQALIDTRFSGETLARHEAECFQQIDEAAIARARERGNEIVIVSPEARAAAAERLQPAIDGIIDEVEATGRPARAFYDALRAEIEIVRAELAAE